MLNTPEGMYKAVLDGIKKESTAVLTPDRFNRLINNFALIDWLNEKAPKNDYDQAINDDLRRLYKNKEVSISGEVFPLESNYHRLQSVMFKVEDGDWVGANRLKTDTISKLNRNPYRKPDNDRLYYYQEGDYVKLFPKADNYKKAWMFYIARPKSINFDPTNTPSTKVLIEDLGIEQCRQIVDIAIRIEIERVKEERYQTQLMEEQLRNLKQ